MILVPAIDILDGKAVRLTRGAFDAPTLYDADPLEAALRWESAGARALHVVDLRREDHRAHVHGARLRPVDALPALVVS